ncbi:MAG: radical SAM protein [Planctomycetota bacterium]|jgi:uncharacterized radical SAM superfamily Fe-S cluster-containing enzyme
MNTLGITHSVCSKCGALVPAKVVSKDDEVSLLKFCKLHGAEKGLIWNGVEDYIEAHRYVKPAWVPEKSYGYSEKPCPEGCGFCGRHEQHLCTPIIEITSRCNLSCPVCLVDAGGPWDMSLEEFRTVLDRMIVAEKFVHVLNLSGGEPFCHPEIESFLSEAVSRNEIVRVSVSTNGLALLENPRLAGMLKEKNVVVSLQFDGFDDSIYKTFRGRMLLDEKLRILDLLAEYDIATTLTMTVAAGVNDDQFPAMLENLFSRPHVMSMMIQPICFAGRAADLKGTAGRLAIPDIIRALGNAGHASVSSEDFMPLPCSHPLCFALSFYLVLDDGKAVPVKSLVQADKYIDALKNQAFFGLHEDEHERMKELVYDLWSGPAGNAPDSRGVLSTLHNLLQKIESSTTDPKEIFCSAERKVKSIFIHAFQDEETFDLARLRRCCNAYPQANGRFIPACANNIFHRKKRR